MDISQQQIPPATLRWLGAIPATAAVALLIRHSARDALTPGEPGYGLPINAAGLRLATQLGTLLRGRLRSLHTSPLQRCRDTAAVLRSTAAPALTIAEDRMLGDPGAYVLDAQQAWRNWERLGSEGLMARLCHTDECLPGTAHPDEGARRLLHHMLATAGAVAGVHVFVSHDILVAVTAARFLGPPRGPSPWPDYLEGAFFWQDAGGIHAAYRDDQRSGIAL